EDNRKLMLGANSCVNNFVNVTEGDKVLIIADKPQIAVALAKASQDAGGEVLIIYLPPSRVPIERLSDMLKSVILESSIVFTPFDPKPGEIHFIMSILELAAEGAKRKIAHMPYVTKDMFIKGMLSLNQDEIKEMTNLTEKLAYLLSATTKIHIESVAGTSLDLVFSESWSHSGVVSTGHIVKGSWGNLPSGEAFVLPQRGMVEGKIVIDKAILEYSLAEVPVAMEVINGIINLNSIKGGKELKQDLLSLSKKYGEAVKTVCEFGIGTNSKSHDLKMIEIEKILGTVHIAIGSNTEYGGDIKAPIHTDMVISEPTVTVFDLQSKPRIIIEKGKIEEDRIDMFFKTNYENFTEERSIHDTIQVKHDVEVEVNEEGLQRCWYDYRGHRLCISIGNELTAKEVLKVWKFIDTENPKRVGKILTDFNKIFNKDDKFVYQLLNTLEKFGIIKIKKVKKKQGREA
ncbi:aminopeptidase, partial [Candidatus Pacearchaeota archaeon]|nr:aminopeptidase [Candidatus Pacearchaeota archaeon]